MDTFMIYDIINNENQQIIFNYCILLVLIIFIFQQQTINMSILFGLILFYCILSYYYNYRKTNNLEYEKINKNKFEQIQTNNNILSKYTDINDLLFYFLNFKEFSIDKYNQIILLFSNFITLYEVFIIQPKLINDNYNTFIDLQNKIINTFDEYKFIVIDNTYYDIINKTKNNANEILTKYINEINILHKKSIDLNGYNINTKIIDKNVIKPVNFYIENTTDLNKLDF
jgi:hypothetical protein